MSAMSGPDESRSQTNGAGLRLSTVWVVAAFALPMTIVLVGPLDTIDLAYVIRAGRIMLRTGDVLRTDAFLFTTRCEPWANQQWGAEVLSAGVFDTLGWLGLALVRAGLAAAIVGFVYAACRDYGAERRAAAWLTLLAGRAAPGRPADARPALRPRVLRGAAVDPRAPAGPPERRLPRGPAPRPVGQRARELPLRDRPAGRRVDGGSRRVAPGRPHARRGRPVPGWRRRSRRSDPRCGGTSSRSRRTR